MRNAGGWVGWAAAVLVVVGLSGCSCEDRVVGVVSEQDLDTVPPGECIDGDGDGYGVGPGCKGPDCDDSDAALGNSGMRRCYSGAAGTEGVGACKAGTQSCQNGLLSACDNEVVPTAETCDGVDNDCDGQVDQNVTRSCYGGPSGTEGVGACLAGTQLCTNGSFGECTGEVRPTAETCDGVDNDCNGQVDENLVRSCYGGPTSTEGIGACHGGTQTCTNGSYGACTGEVRPTPETCDGVDNDCNGQVDESVTRSCYAGPAGTAGVGICRAGTQLCSNGAFGACVGEVLPAAETCDGVDNDCDGQVDENVTKSCYPGPAGTAGVGACRAGAQVCVNGAFGACTGAVVPSAETCDGVDNDCDGQVDESVTRRCYDGATGTDGVGACHAGTQLCTNGSFGACTGEVTPSTETCDGVDNDCDGQVDENVTRSCYGGPAGTEGVGSCRAGTQLCTNGSYGAGTGEIRPSAETCDGADNDCNGQVDENLTRTCYDGPAGTQNTGACRAGTQVCTNGAYGACTGQVLPAAETCDGVDNDCNGDVDENLTRTCYGGPSGTDGVGACRAGTQLCTNGSYGACTGEIRPSAETCDGVDNDCDGAIDENVTRSCYGGPAGTEGVGSCRAGTQICSNGAFGACTGEVQPTAETCDGVDNDCDGKVDQNVTRSCYGGPSGTDGVGACRAGSQICVNGAFGACTGEVRPSPETCDGVDNDCDGSVDENIVRACYGGPAGTEGIGACRGGTQTCSNGAFGACTGEVQPAPETCDGMDNDCNGQVDENLTRSCYGGPAGTEGIGVCRAGTQTCTNGAYGTCAGEARPSAEICDGADNDCDGQVDENVTRSCYGGPSGTQGVGACQAGTQLCTNGAFGACVGEVRPSAETCDAVDNDCDGQVDENIVRSCYDGPAGTDGVGVCHGGRQLCTNGTFSACVGQALPSAESCDALDNDCDGAVDDGLVRSCYDGPSGTAGVGACRGGSAVCTAGVWGACSSEVMPQAETCDAVDNDCNGQVDENVTKSCYGGPAGTEGVGQCRKGLQLCSNGAFGACQGAVLPSAETCDGVDNDCNGSVDENLVRGCYDGPSGTAGVGACRAGTQTCSKGAYGACANEVTPSSEICDAVDNDCDGQVDENVTRTCYGGPAGTSGVGQCRSGTQTCTNGAFGGCVGEVRPAAEGCDGVDNDCDGQVDEALVRSCYTGPQGTDGVGICARGSQSCSAGAWGSCDGQTLPRAETCNALDDDCNGQVDENITRACYEGPAGTAGIGVCQAGTQTCSAGSFGSCIGQVTPSAETCDGRDNDCDGTADENLTRRCYGGPSGTDGVGLCHGGTQTCTAGSYGTCQGEVRPSPETCDNQDNDCNGQTDENLNRSCYSGPSGTAGVGQCRQGTQICVAGAYGGCVGEITPSPETCDNRDNDCDGAVDENVTRACYDGPAGTSGVGQCLPGVSVCTAGQFGECTGEVTPGWGELCGTGVDEDCNGQVDEAGCLGVGTWVCTTCSNASDSNPGTQVQPLKTVNRGIAQANLYGFHKVYLANADASTAAVYGEDVTLVEGISVEGRWDPTPKPWIRRSTVRTIIRNQRATGLSSPAGITRATVLDGVEVQSAGAVGGAATAVAIDVVDSSPTLHDVTAGGLAPGAAVPQTSIGLRVSGASAFPRMEGVTTSQLSKAKGGQATTTATGILVSGAKIDLQTTDVSGGIAAAGGVARGVWLSSAKGSLIRSNQLVGGNATTCMALDATGDVSALVVEGNTAVGCQDGALAPNRGAGVVFEGCAALTGVAPEVRANTMITGGSVPGGESSYGVVAVDNCPLQIHDNASVSGGDALAATGILCGSTIWSRPAGADSACVIDRNTVYGGTSTTVGTGIGIACLGTCASKDRACLGSCQRVSQNEVSATAGSTLEHIRVVHSSPFIARNRLGLAGAGVACTLRTGVTGLKLQGADSRVENNILLAGPCETAVGLAQVNEKRSGDGSWPAPDVHSNSIIGGGSSANTTGSQSFGVTMQSNGTPPSGLGRYRNNIIVGGQNNHRTSFVEMDAASDPELLWNNDFWNFARANGPNPILYLNENSKSLATVAEIQAMNDTGVVGTLSVDPLFVNEFFEFHLQPISPLRDRGVTSGAPAVDFDGDLRLGGDGKPDVGADELR